jgi:hypothetical protein
VVTWRSSSTIGWSQMTEGIAASLGVTGLALSGGAVTPKLRHVELARDLAVRILGEYPFAPPLTDEQKELITPRSSSTTSRRSWLQRRRPGGDPSGL